MSLPVRIEGLGHTVAARRLTGSLINLSRGGACLRTSLPVGTIGDVVRLSFFLPNTHERQKIRLPETPDATSPAEFFTLRLTTPDIPHRDQPFRSPACSLVSVSSDPPRVRSVRSAIWSPNTSHPPLFLRASPARR